VPAQQIAVPFYGPQAFVAALQANSQAPQAARFASSALALVDAIETLCTAAGEARPTASSEADAPPGEALRAARDAWLTTANAWERLEAISVGATLQRRSARTVDFRPTRPARIKRAIAAYGKAKQPPDAKALERVGTPAKGLPALEWLLWDDSAPRSAAACRYATGLAQDVRREADELAAAHAADAARWRDEIGEERDEAAAARAAEAVNQWLAGLEGLRWRQLGKPLAVMTSKSGSPMDANQDIWPRPPSASHRAAWQARWESLRKLAIGPAPTDGFGPQPAVAPAVISLEALLRGRGRNDDADAWAKTVMAADQAIQALTATGDSDTRAVGQPPSAGAPQSARVPAGKVTGHESVPLPSTATMEKAIQALDVVKQFMQATVAPALEVALGFSDADGD
jgi:predicted lipoprotein